MPRKSTTTTRPAASTAKSAPRQISRAAAALQSFDPQADLSDHIENENGDDDDAAANGEDNDMLEMLNMLQEFQKRKATKASTRSTAFQSKKNVLFTEARKNVDVIVRDGVACIDQCLMKIADLRSQETSQENQLKDLSLMWNSHDETVHTLLQSYPALIEDLSHRRAAQINDASAMLEEHVVERQRSRRRLILNAKARMDENLEKQKLATDATALIKHYKALLLS